MPNVQIPGVGNVSFPDSMSSDDITAAIERDILPNQKPAAAPAPATSDSDVDTALSNAAATEGNSSYTVTPAVQATRDQASLALLQRERDALDKEMGIRQAMIRKNGGTPQNFAPAAPALPVADTTPATAAPTPQQPQQPAPDFDTLGRKAALAAGDYPDQVTRQIASASNDSRAAQQASNATIAAQAKAQSRWDTLINAIHAGANEVGGGVFDFLAAQANKGQPNADAGEKTLAGHSFIPSGKRVKSVAPSPTVSLGQLVSDKDPNTGEYVPPPNAQQIAAETKAITPAVRKMDPVDAYNNGVLDKWVLAQAGGGGSQVAMMAPAILYPEMAPAVFSALGMSSAGEHYKQLVDSGVDPHKAAQTIVANAAVNTGSNYAMMGLSKLAAPMFLKVLNAIPESEKFSLAREALRYALATGATAASEATVNAGVGAGTQVASNVIDKTLAGTDTSLTEGVPAAAMQGATIGAVMPLLHAAAGAPRAVADAVGTHVAEGKADTARTDALAKAATLSAGAKKAAPDTGTTVPDSGINPLVPPTDLDVIKRAGEELRAHAQDQTAPLSPETQHVAQHIDDVLADPAQKAAFEGDQSTIPQEEGTGAPATAESPVGPPAESAAGASEKASELPTEQPEPQNAATAPETGPAPLRAEDIGVPSAVDRSYFTAQKGDGELSIPQTEEEQGIQTGLNARLVRAGLPELQPGAIRIEEPTEAEAALSDEFKKTFGTQVTWITSAEKTGVDGFVQNRDGGNRTIYLVRPEGDFNRSTAMFLAGHELTHVMRQLHPDIYAELHTAMKDFVTPDDKFEAAGVHAVADEDRGNGLGSKLDEEINADYGGRLLSDPKFVDTLRKSNPDLFGRVASIVKDFLDKMTAMVQKVAPSNSKFVRDTATARDAWVKALTEFAKREQSPQSADERRVDTERRKAVDEMSPEEMKAALKTDEMTGLGNRRAYDEAPKKAVTVSVDADSLKWINDNMGHEAGDHLLRLIGEALKGHDAYHISGDEFLAQFDSRGQAAVAMKTVEQALKKAVLTVETPDGKTITIKGVGATHGIGADKASADVELNKRKSERQAAGERAGRGEPPPGLVRKPGRSADRQAQAPAEGKPDRAGKAGGSANAKPAAVESEAPRAEAVKPAADREAAFNKAFDSVGNMQLDSELKKSTVRAFVNRAFANKLLRPEDHAEIIRTLKDMDAEDALDELHTSLLYNAEKEGISASVTTRVEVPKHLAPYLTDEELETMSTRRLNKVLEVLEQLPGAGEFAQAALAGQAQRGWYKRVLPDVKAVYGDDAPRFIALLAALSPQTDVKGNVYNAVKVFAAWEKAKRTTDTGKLKRIFDRNLVTDTGREDGKAAMTAWLHNGVRALTTIYPESVNLSGPKVESFRRNMLGDLDELTNDRHMAAFAGVDQSLFKGQKPKDSLIQKKSAGYIAFNARQREAAEHLTSYTGDKWTPAEVQETVWSWWKALTSLATTAKGETRSAVELLRQGEVRDNLVRAVPQFGDFFHDPEIQRILEGSGRRAAGDEGSDQAADHRRDGTQSKAGPAPDESILEDAARRLDERLAARRTDELAASPDREQADAGELQDGRGLRGSVQLLDEPSGSHPLADRPLQGLPTRVKVDGQEVTFGPHLPARAAAADYMREAGLPYNPPHQYAKVDKARATRIAEAFEAMKHEPDHPAVKASYDAMIRETLAQWQAIKKTGLKVEFIKGDDPYGNPRNAILDVVRNNHLWVFPTDDGFGGSESAHVDISGNPLLAPTDEVIDGHKLRANDVFRIVHDYFGHIKEGVGFRAEGEENAWQQHQAMYSDVARPAMTTETRGQNSWVNFGPYAESNKTASGADTQYAPQKIGLLPRFATDEGISASKTRDEEDVSAAPARSIGDAILKTFSPASRGDLAQQTAGLMRDNLARQARDREIAFHDLEQHMKMFDKLSPKESYDFIDAMEHGLGRGRLSVLGHPEWEEPAKALANLLDQRRATVASLGTGKLQQFIENYFPHIWADPAKAQQFFAARRPLEGGKAFLKQRTYEDFTDGLAAGLKPLTDNPVRLALLKAREMDRYIYGQRIFQEMKDNGLAVFVRFGKKAPDGWTKLDDKIAKVMFPASSGEGMIQAGEYFAPDGAATVFNNHLSPGWAGHPVFDLVRKSGNMLNAAQLGLSLFHLGFTTADAMISKTALGFYKLGHGSILSGASDLAQGAVSVAQPFVNLYKGDRLLRAYLGKLQDPGLAPVVEALVQSGGRVTMDDFYRNAGVSEFRDALRTGRYGSAAAHFLPTVIDRVMAPVMQWLVPRQKLGVFFDMAHYALKENPNMSLDEKRAMLGKMWDSVDNRMGQMVYDNLFWKRTLKDAAMVSVRSVGWNLGTIRELGGGVLDLKDIPKGGLSTRTAYIAALTFNAALWGSIMQYLMTGQGPEEKKDMFFPKTGRIRPDGTEDRVSLPTYMKDIYEYSHDISGFVKYGANPAQTLLNKMHPLISMVAQMLTNEDFFGAAIRNPGDDWQDQLKDEIGYVVKQIQPFGIRNFQQQKSTAGTTGEGSPLEDVANYVTSPTFFGITPSPGYITKSDEQTESAMVSKMRDSLVSKYRQQIKDGEDPTDVEYRAQRAGLSPRDVRYILNAATPRPPKMHKFGIQ